MAYKVNWLLSHNGKDYQEGDIFNEKPSKQLLEDGVLTEIVEEKAAETEDVKSEKAESKAAEEAETKATKKKK